MQHKLWRKLASNSNSETDAFITSSSHSNVASQKMRRTRSRFTPQSLQNFNSRHLKLKLCNKTIELAFSPSVPLNPGHPCFPRGP